MNDDTFRGGAAVISHGPLAAEASPGIRDLFRRPTSLSPGTGSGFLTVIWRVYGAHNKLRLLCNERRLLVESL